MIETIDSIAERLEDIISKADNALMGYRLSKAEWLGLWRGVRDAASCAVDEIDDLRLLAAYSEGKESPCSLSPADPANGS